MPKLHEIRMVAPAMAWAAGSSPLWPAKYTRTQTPMPSAMTPMNVNGKRKRTNPNKS